MRYASHIAEAGDAGGDTKKERIATLRRAVEGLQSTPVWMGSGGNAGRSAAASLVCGLPAPGVPRGVLNEIVAAPQDRAAACGFLFALTAAALRESKGSALFIAARQTLDFGRPCGHGLNGMGVEVGRVMLVEADADKDALWAIEEALRSEARPAIVAGIIAGGLDLTQSRRLNLAAATHGIPLILLRGARTAAASAAVTRWRIAPAPASCDRFGTFDAWRWHVMLERCRNGRTGEWTITWDPAARRFSPLEASETTHAGSSSHVAKTG